MPHFAAKNYPPEEITYLALLKELDGCTSRDVPKLDLLAIVNGSKNRYVKALIRKHGLKNVRSVARRLLEEKVFKKRAVAEKKFSHTVYFTDCEEDWEKALSEDTLNLVAGGRRPRPKGLGDVEERPDIWPHNYTESKWRNEPLLNVLAGVCCRKKWKNRPIPLDDNENPLHPHPVALPMRNQHPLLGNLVQLLEVSCYKFAVVRAPEILAARNTIDPEECELTGWTTDFSHKKTFRCEDKAVFAHREAVLANVARMRHDTVHRRRVGADTIAGYFRSAEELTMLMGDTEARDTISKMWQAIGKEVKALMHATMAKFQAHTKAMDPIRLKQEALDARQSADLTYTQREAMNAERKQLLAAEEVIAKQAKQDYRGLSDAAGRAVERALAEHGIILGTLGVSFSPPNVPTNVEGPREGEMVDIGGDAAEIAVFRPQKKGRVVGDSPREAEDDDDGDDEGDDEGESSDVQPSENTADVKGEHNEQNPRNKKIQMSEQQQDIDEGGTPLRRQGEAPPSAKVRLILKREPTSVQQGTNTGCEAGLGGVPVKRDAILYSRKVQPAPKEEQKAYPADGSQNRGSSPVRRKGRGFRSKKKRAPFEVQGIPGLSYVN
ncbi:unnamed protein product [Clonostachys byssicola]|uniref:Uncharacterized protein n=1 Tax=Clonostachys byssicola TaxID=160290 RepID=A0A9N9Y4E1_9HYPO|nr:unnamed protein product [Clonostachys byssicola]